MTRSLTCHCGRVISAADAGSLVGPVWAHFGEAHPELGLTETAVRNYLEAEDRSTGPIEPLAEIGRVDIVAITPERGDDIAAFFDRDAFPDNPAWASCYCMFYFLGGADNPNWGNRPWEEVREAQLGRIAAGQTTGALAYVDGRLAGWCNATRRAEFPGLATGDDAGVASVVCFVVAPPYRGHRLATRLLDGVVEQMRGRGFTRIEAHPVRDPDDARAAFHGSLQLFTRAGFDIVSDEPLVVGMEL